MGCSVVHLKGRTAEVSHMKTVVKPILKLESCPMHLNNYTFQASVWVYSCVEVHNASVPPEVGIY